MSVKLTPHKKGDVIIVDVSGRLTLGESTSALRTMMRELVEGGSTADCFEHGRGYLH